MIKYKVKCLVGSVSIRSPRMKFVVKNIENFDSLLFEIDFIFYRSIFCLLESYISCLFIK